MGLKIKWDITYKCNLNCKHCVNGEYIGKLDNELTTNQVFTVIDNLSRLNIDFVHILGGEPTAREDFIEIIRYMDKKNIFFGFNTNGLKFNDDKLLNEISVNKHIKNIIFSIEGPIAEINDNIRGKNVFNITINNLKRLIYIKEKYKLSNLIITINTVLSKLNKDYLNDMIDFCIDLGVDQLVLLQLINEGNAKNINASLNFEEEVEAIKIIANKYKSIKDKLDINPKFTRPLAIDYCKNILGLEFPEVIHGCGAGVNFAYMNNKGEVYPCDRYIEQIKKENILSNLSLVENEFYDIWGLPKYDELYKITEGTDFYQNLEPCKDCKYLRTYCYPCPLTIKKINNMATINSCKKFLDLIEKYKSK